jgi:hypothetical protein
MIVIPEQGFVLKPTVEATDTTPAGLVAYARGQFAVAAAATEAYLLDNGFSPFELAPMDVASKCGIGWWRDDVGFTGPDYPGTELIVYVNVTPPAIIPEVPDNPPPA